VDDNSEEEISDLPVPPVDFDLGYQMHEFFVNRVAATPFSVTKVLKDNIRVLEWNDKKTSLSVEALEVLMAMPGFGEVGYGFVKMFRCKEGMRPFNGTVTTVLPKEKYIVGWDPPNGKSETVSHAVL
jgi:hypothetical protein